MDNPDAYQHHRVPNDAAHTLFGHQLISDQMSKEGLSVVCRELERVLAAPVQGDVVEFGCYVGTTSLFIRRLLDQHKQTASREFHVYDSFEGLPAKSPQDNSAAGVDFAAGKLQVGKKELLRQFHLANLAPPIIHKCWFNELTAEDIPSSIAFAFLDGDFYQSITDSLRLVWPRMSVGGAIVIDDYRREALPGVDKAVAEFFANKPARIRSEHNKAIIVL